MAGETDLDLALEAWRAEHGAAWQLDVDSVTGYGDFLYGGAARLGDRPGDDQGFFQLAAVSAIASFPLHGIEPETLVLDRVAFLPLRLISSTDKTTVRLAQEVRGVRVEGGYLNVLFDHAEGYLLSVQSTALPGLVDFPTEPALSSEDALLLARLQLELDEGIFPTELTEPLLLITPILEGENGEANTEEGAIRRPYLTWRVQASADHAEKGPVSLIYSFDAQTGELRRTLNAIKHFDVSGTVFSKVTTAGEALHSTSATMEKPMSRIYIYAAGAGANDSPIGTADENGNFTIPGTHPLTVQLRYAGSKVPRVQNDLGVEHSEEFTTQAPSGNEFKMNAGATEEVTAQANAYYWITRLHDWILEANPADSVWEDNDFDFIDVHVYDPGLGNMQCQGKGELSQPPLAAFSQPFVAGNSTCASTNCSPDPDLPCSNQASEGVIVHETAHALNNAYRPGITSDAFDEGLADAFSLYVRDEVLHNKNLCVKDPESDCLWRRGDNSLRACPSGNGTCHPEPHLAGQVLMGAFWKMRERLKVSEGADGESVADALFNAWLIAYSGESINAQVRTQLLSLDDGAILPSQPGFSDGTPHWADINYGFAGQGYPIHASFVNGITVTNVTDPGVTSNQVGPYTISATVVANFAAPITAVNLYYRVNGGAFQSPIAMTPSGSNFAAVIPGQTAPAIVEYYITARDSTEAGPLQVGQTIDYPVLQHVAYDATPDQFGANDDLQYAKEEAKPKYRRFFVGEKVTLLAEDFEPPMQLGWTHGGSLDDWEFADPSGFSTNSWADPSTAYSGQQCAENDLTGDGILDGAYEPSADNWLLSPSFNIVPGTKTYLSFQRWLSVESWNESIFPFGTLDFAEIWIQLDGSSSEVQVWMNHRSINHVDNKTNNSPNSVWQYFELDITQALANATAAKVRWLLKANGSANTLYGGWAIDDVEVFHIEAP